MATPIIMPKFEMTQEEATVLRWLRQEGDTVEQGEPLLEVETDKVVMEVEAPASGVLGGILAPAGQVVPVTTIIAHILKPGEEAPAPEKAGGQPEASSPARRPTPVARRYAAEAGVDLEQVPLPDASGRITRQDVDAYLAGPAARPGQQAEPRPRATPAARRVARERGLDLAGIAGSGPRSRVQAADVLAKTRPAPSAAEPVPLPPAAPEEGEIVPLQGKRRTIAARLQQSYQTAPHIMLTVEADMTAVEALRQELNREAETAGLARVSVTAILVKVCAWALARHRWLNASLRGDQIHLFPSPNVGLAVAVEDGLVVPVISQAERLGLKEIAGLVQELTQKARQNRLTPADVAGGTFTISNLGMFGIDSFTAIINPPQAAILAVGRIAKRVIVVEQEGLEKFLARPMMTMTLAADHRIIDGAVAAQFLRDVVKALEQPSLLLW